MNNDELKTKIDKALKNATFIVGNPKTVDEMRQRGLPVKSTFISNEDYVEKLLKDKRDKALELVAQLPRLDDSIANATVATLYDEIRESYVLNIAGAAITLSAIMLELALKYRLYNEWLKDDSNSLWEHIEQKDMSKTINLLKKRGIITASEKAVLATFNREVRNPYLHYNIQKLVEPMILSELPSVNTNTGEVTVEYNVPASKYSFAWFSAKQALDKGALVDRVAFCISWTNRLLAHSDS